MATPVAVRGTTALTHAWMDDSVADVVQQHIEFVGDTPDLAVYLSDITTPAGAHRRWLALERRGAIVYQSADFELLLDQPRASGRRPQVSGAGTAA